MHTHIHAYTHICRYHRVQIVHSSPPTSNQSVRSSGRPPSCHVLPCSVVPLASRWRAGRRSSGAAASPLHSKNIQKTNLFFVPKDLGDLVVAKHLQLLAAPIHVPVAIICRPSRMEMSGCAVGDGPRPLILRSKVGKRDGYGGMVMLLMCLIVSEGHQVDLHHSTELLMASMDQVRTKNLMGPMELQHLLLRKNLRASWPRGSWSEVI